MKAIRPRLFIAALACNASVITAQSSSGKTPIRAAGDCPTNLAPRFGAPVVGSGWTAQLIAANLTKPRGIVFDQRGALLVVQQGSGIVRLTFTDYGGTCLVVNETTTVVDNPDLNHSLELSAEGCELYASTSDKVFRWPYDSRTGTVGENETLVANMSNTDHVTRTLLLSRKSPNTLLVSRGSSENMDPAALQIATGHSQVRAFDISDLPSDSGGRQRPYNYPSEGRLLGWGLRNDVGVAEHPVTGGIYSVENSADGLYRYGYDIHEDNPGEEMNFLGSLDGNGNGSAGDQSGGNYGYPLCFALSHTDGFPGTGDMTVGSQFALGDVIINSQVINDTTCARDYIPPRLTFQAHTAPLDIIFNPEGDTAYVSFHGSWDRTHPAGYVVSTVDFDSAAGEPLAPADSTHAVTADILSNADLSRCPDACFRPVGLAWDGQGRLFVSSDATGEVYVLQRAEFSISGGGGFGFGFGGEDGSDGDTGSGINFGNGTGTDTTSATGTSEPFLVSMSTRDRPGVEVLWLALLVTMIFGVLS
ncbi:hypothetical protein VPNG_08994 [Cytospora leucostoma]|uniref:Pyrroloquinoline quinone-dependent pyranose dehydrogenase beta-propeller domain-containing protein n=1 Tax=Cytospora leucostoma TaxID=1230097 RepID=A0A423VZW2_9PEZI|nr:hypothetical protein VPNG_08994 [Cytospora leucostoma]